MLTMLNNSAKEKVIKEYLRVLKPGGRLLTHDVSHQDEDTANLIDQLRHTINVNVAPLKIDDWKNLFLQNGFSSSEYQFGKMSLMSPLGMIKDEGLFNTIKIISRGLKNERCPHPKLINVLEGKLEIILGVQKHILEKDSLISLSPEETHHLRAIENSKFLQIELD